MPLGDVKAHGQTFKVGDRPAGRVSTGLPAAANDPAEVLGKRGMLTVARFAARLGIPIEGISKML